MYQPIFERIAPCVRIGDPILKIEQLNVFFTLILAFKREVEVFWKPGSRTSST